MLSVYSIKNGHIGCFQKHIVVTRDCRKEKRTSMAQNNPNPTPEPENREEIHVKGSDLADKVKDLIHEGNVRRIIIRQGEHTIVEMPLSVGVVGTLLAPW